MSPRKPESPGTGEEDTSPAPPPGERQPTGSLSEILRSSLTDSAWGHPPPGDSRSSGEGPFEHGRFLPGAMLGGRYRIVGLLGKGGMGEVYRADDLELGQSVALKLLPGEVVRDEERLVRFRNEVRLARQISHANVCRVYDIGEAGGQRFISMEYIDGEDLATLLRRIGRFSVERASEIGRQLCLGLAAAHERGVLHRDLKPANIMIDGRGKVVITDFGLAGWIDRIPQEEVRSGTPAYMAPEQLSGQEVTVRSDLYSLGLVLHELFTGRPAYQATSAEELVKEREGTPTPTSSRPVGELDRAVEHLILRCLENAPADRPSSALAVAAALPGGDPLAAALAAGEVPSPDMVAASGERGAVGTAVGATLLAVILAGMALTAWMTDHLRLYSSQATFDLPPAVLVERARRIIEKFGHERTAVDSVHRLYLDPGYLIHVYRNIEAEDRWERLARRQPAGVSLWYRQAPGPLVSTRLDGRVRARASPPPGRGEILVRLSAAGDLTSFEVIPPAYDTGESDAGDSEGPAVDWSVAFSAAGLEFDRFTPAEPIFAPLHGVPDRRLAWTGAYRDNSEVTVRVEAASLHGKPVLFKLIDPWNLPPVDRAVAGWRENVGSLGSTIGHLAWHGLYLGGVVAAFAIAYRNLRLRKGDRPGALRLAVVVVGVRTFSWLCTAHHAAAGHFERIAAGIGGALWWGAVAYALYLALEPYIRRTMPSLLVSSTRLLAGRYRDPLVGRDILIGLSFFPAISLLAVIFYLVQTGVTGQPGILDPPGVKDMHSLRAMLGYVASSVVDPGILVPLLLAVAFSLLTVVARRPAIAVPLFFLFVTALATFHLRSVSMIADITAAVGVAGVVTFVLVRFGLLSLSAMVIAHWSLFWAPLTFRTDAWYAPMGYAVAALFLVLAFCCFRVATARRFLAVVG